MPASFNLPSPVSRNQNDPPPAPEVPNVAMPPLNQMTDEQKHYFFDAELKRLQEKPDRTDKENARMAAIERFLAGTHTGEDMGLLYDAYAMRRQQGGKVDPANPGANGTPVVNEPV